MDGTAAAHPARVHPRVRGRARRLVHPAGQPEPEGGGRQWAAATTSSSPPRNQAMVTYYVRLAITLRVIGGVGGLVLGALFDDATGLDTSAGAGFWIWIVLGWLLGASWAEYRLTRPCRRRAGRVAHAAGRCGDYLSARLYAAPVVAAAVVLLLAAFGLLAPTPDDPAPPTPPTAGPRDRRPRRGGHRRAHHAGGARRRRPPPAHRPAGHRGRRRRHPGQRGPQPRRRRDGRHPAHRQPDVVLRARPADHGRRRSGALAVRRLRCSAPSWPGAGRPTGTGGCVAAPPTVVVPS